MLDWFFEIERGGVWGFEGWWIVCDEMFGGVGLMEMKGLLRKGV